MDIMKVGSIKRNDYSLTHSLPNDLLITVRTKVNNEEPYFLLYQCAEGKPSGFDSIARIKITQQSPKTIDDINPTYVSPSITNDCKKAILEWSKASDNWGLNNWESLKDKYNSVNSSLYFEVNN